MDAKDGKRLLVLPQLDEHQGFVVFGLTYFPNPYEVLTFNKLTISEMMLPDGTRTTHRNYERLATGEQVLTEMPKHGYSLEMLEHAFNRASSRRIEQI